MACLMDEIGPFPEISFEKGINEFYACLKKVPGFKDTKKWTKEPSHVDLLHYLFGKLRLLKGAKREWAFVRDEDGNLSLVFYKVIQAYSHGSTMPLEWLPGLEKKNPELHEAFIAIIGAIAKRWNLDLIYTPNIDYYILDGMLQEADEELDMKLIEFDVEKYRKGGLAHHYSKRMMTHGGKSIEQLKKLLSKVHRTTTHGQRAICSLCHAGIELLKFKATIDDYHTPEILSEEEVPNRGEVVAPRDYYRFVWSYLDNVNDYNIEVVSNFENEVGSANIIIKDHYYPKKKTVTVIQEPIKVLNRFFYHAYRIYREYYHDQMDYQRRKDIKQIEISLGATATVCRKVYINK